MFAILFAVLALVFGHAGNGASFIFTLIFPPGFYIFAVRAMAGWENNLHPTDALRGDPDNHVQLLQLLIAALVCVTYSYSSIIIDIYDYNSDQRVSMALVSRSFGA